MVRNDIFIKGAIITAVLLLFSIIVGNYVEGMAYVRMDDALIRINENNEAVFIIQSYADENDTRLCDMIKQQINSINSNIYTLREEVEAQKVTSVLNNYDTLRRKYFLSNARLLAFTKQYIKRCGADDQIILFFYTSEKECPECYAQGRILDEVRNRCNNIKVFSFPVDVDMPIIKSFMAFYGVEKSPSLVIDMQGQDIVFDKVTSANDIIKATGCK
ncbi:MAG: hypothetical protein ACP5H8_02080 [Candidatus Micrarchaeia archaeon]